jgi:hypothetical protein
MAEQLAAQQALTAAILENHPTYWHNRGGLENTNCATMPVPILNRVSHGGRDATARARDNKSTTLHDGKCYGSIEQQIGNNIKGWP